MEDDEMEVPTDLITVQKGRKVLGVSSAKMAQLLKSGLLRHYLNPLDKRVKLVSQAELLALKPQSKEAA